MPKPDWNCLTCGGAKHVRVLRHDQRVEFAGYECRECGRLFWHSDPLGPEVTEAEWLLNRELGRCGLKR